MPTRSRDEVDKLKQRNKTLAQFGAKGTICVGDSKSIDGGYEIAQGLGTKRIFVVKCVTKRIVSNTL